MELDAYKKIYLSEARDIISDLNNQMVELEKDAANQEVINAIFRGAHTLKGMSATMGYDPIVKLAHSMESVLALVRSQKLKITGEITELLFSSIDALDEAVKAVGKEKLDKIAVADLVEKLDKITAGISGEEKASTKAAPVEMPLDKETQAKLLAGRDRGLTPWKVQVKLSGDCKMRIARALIVLQQFSLLGEVLNFNQLLEGLKTAGCALDFSFYLLAKRAEDEINLKVGSIPEVANVNFMVFVPAPIPSGPRAAPVSEEKPTVRIGVEKLDKLMNLIGEIAISKIRLHDVSRRIANRELEEILGYFGRQSTELQAEMMEMRLFPLEYIFANFPRLVRNTAHEEGKEADLITSGAEIGLDRTVLDEINEPLIHLLRNAVSHGIETPDERASAGKDRRGKVHLSASRERNFVVIEVSDDGAGMDPQEIKKLAIEKGLISSGEAAELSDEDALLLICNPNFSTSKKTTETSGRGVGMNVVKTAAESLGGAVSITSEKGKGSTFTMRLPLSVAIMQSLLISLNSETYAIPLSSITETIKISPQAVKKVGTKSEIINYRGMVLPLLRLREKFRAERSEIRDQNIRNNLSSQLSALTSQLSVVVVESASKKVGLVVDSLLGQQEVVVKSLSGSLKRLEGVSGATILGSGKVALIIDVGAVIK